MKTLIYLILAFTHFLMISCDKISKEETIVSGSAINIKDGEPLVNYTIVLKELKSTFPGVDVTILNTLKTNIDGTFQLNFDSKKSNKYNYELEIEYDYSNFLGYGSMVDRIALDKGETNTVTFKLAKGAQIQFLLINDEPRYLDDLIIVGINDTYFNDPALITHSGASNYESVGDIKVNADVQFDCKFTVTSNGINTDSIIQLTIPHGTTKLIEFHY